MAREEQHIDLTVVVSGAPQRVRINVHQKLESAIREALRESGNTGRDLDEWELRTEDGALLDQALRADEAGLHSGQTLFLSPRAGIGG